ncbi:hypothetical protein MTBLM5_370007 [Magnetospirillum sp. LM-5]|nr:hypothetical protein MTBLM5_370007 [Magnetospirillum sp. LM-5]
MSHCTISGSVRRSSGSVTKGDLIDRRPDAAQLRHHPRHHRRGDAPFLPRLRHERDRGACAARRP